MPPCSGKTTFLKQIALVLLENIPDCSLQFSTGEKTRTFSVELAYNLLTAIGSPGEFLEYIGNPESQRPLYLLLDESQHTYPNNNWWKNLYRQPPYPNVYVIAAGSFGSHSDPLSHSPPEDIPSHLRMSLFDMPGRQLYLAFTKQHLTSCLESHKRLPQAWEDEIIKYASPTTATASTMRGPTLDLGLHPGVVGTLVRFLEERVRCLVLCHPQVLMFGR